MLNKLLLLQKAKAFFWHFLITLVVAALGGVLIFYVWYQDGLAHYVGGVQLYQLVLAVELGLGPVVSLVIYNPVKPKMVLVRDYMLVGFIQLAALVYGLYVVAESRPAYIVFVKDRLEIVMAVELESKDLQAAADTQFSTLPWLGPKSICVEFPKDPQERNDLLISAIGGKDIQFFPKYYRECTSGEREQKWLPAERLRQLVKLRKPELVNELPDLPFSWLPVDHRMGGMVEVYPNNEISQSYYVDIYPFTMAE